MKIMIASTIVPFIEGGGTFIVDWTASKLREYGHQVEVFKIPFSHYPTYILEQMLAMRLFDLADSCDRLISIRTPSYLLSHPNHVSWFIHHYRMVYELWGTKFQSEILLSTEGLALKDVVINSDNVYLRKVKKLFTNSKEVSGRLKQYNNLDSEVLYPPLMDAEDFTCKGYGDFIYYSSRLAANKRQMLAIEAMRHTKSNVKLVITGRSDAQQYATELQKYIEEHSLGSKVKLIDRWISKKEKIDFFSECLAAMYIPYVEDSYGYPSLEAFSSKKAVIACTDSGGTDELITNDQNGYVTEPSPEALAQAMDKLYFEKHKAIEMGEHAYITLQKKGITWQHTIEKLTAIY